MGATDMTYDEVANATIGNKKKPGEQAAKGIAEPPAVQAPGVSVGAGPRPTIYGNGGLPADVVQRGIETMKSQLAASPAAATSPVIAPPAPSTPVPASVTSPAAPDAKAWYAGTDSRDERTGLEMERERRAAATQAGVLNDPVKSALQFGVVGNPAVAQPAPAVGAPPNVSGPAPSISALPDSGMGYMTGAEPGKAPTPFVKPGFGANGVVTAESAQAAMASNSGGIAGGAVDLSGTNAAMARENAMRQQMINAQVGGGTGKPVSWQDQNGTRDPEKDRVAESNALLNKWDKQYQDGQVIAEMGRNPKAAQGIAHFAASASRDESVMRGQEMASKGAVNSDMTTRRGQNMTAANDAAKLAGSPQDQQLKQAQAQGIMAGLESDKMIDDIRKKAIAGDAQSLAVYQSLTGKNNPSYKAIHAAGGQTMDGKNPDQVFVIDERTGNARSLTGGQQAGPSQADLEHTAKKHGITVEQVKARLAQQQGAK